MKPLDAYRYGYTSDELIVLLDLIRASVNQYLMSNKSVISSVITEILHPIYHGDLTFLGFTTGRITGFSDLACH